MSSRGSAAAVPPLVVSQSSNDVRPRTASGSETAGKRSLFRRSLSESKNIGKEVKPRAEVSPRPAESERKPLFSNRSPTRSPRGAAAEGPLQRDVRQADLIREETGRRRKDKTIKQSRFARTVKGPTSPRASPSIVSPRASTGSVRTSSGNVQASGIFEAPDPLKGRRHMVTELAARFPTLSTAQIEVELMQFRDDDPRLVERLQAKHERVLATPPLTASFVAPDPSAAQPVRPRPGPKMPPKGAPSEATLRLADLDKFLEEQLQGSSPVASSASPPTSQQSEALIDQAMADLDNVLRETDELIRGSVVEDLEPPPSLSTPHEVVSLPKVVSVPVPVPVPAPAPVVARESSSRGSEIVELPRPSWASAQGLSQLDDVETAMETPAHAGERKSGLTASQEFLMQELEELNALPVSHVRSVDEAPAVQQPKMSDSQEVLLHELEGMHAVPPPAHTAATTRFAAVVHSKPVQPPVAAQTPPTAPSTKKVAVAAAAVPARNGYSATTASGKTGTPVKSVPPLNGSSAAPPPLKKASTEVYVPSSSRADDAPPPSLKKAPTTTVKVLSPRGRMPVSPAPAPVVAAEVEDDARVKLLKEFRDAGHITEREYAVRLAALQQKKAQQQPKVEIVDMTRAVQQQQLQQQPPPQQHQPQSASDKSPRVLPNGVMLDRSQEERIALLRKLRVQGIIDEREYKVRLAKIIASPSRNAAEVPPAVPAFPGLAAFDLDQRDLADSPVVSKKTPSSKTPAGASTPAAATLKAQPIAQSKGQPAPVVVKTAPQTVAAETSKAGRAAFCHVCGTKVPPEAAAKARFCLSCGEKLL